MKVGLCWIGEQRARAEHLRHCHHALVEARDVVVQRLQRLQGGAQGAAIGHLRLLLGKEDRAFDQLEISQAFPELFLHVQEAVSPDAARERDRKRGHQGAFHQSANCRLMSGMALQRRSREERVCELDIAMQEDSVPRDQDVVEYG